MTIPLPLRICAAAAFLLAAAVRLDAQEPLDTARELYAAAEYNDALTMLDGLAAREHSREDRRSIELYRTLCLLAIGRKADAERTMESMIAGDPLYRPPADDIPPRMRSAISDARKRMLPGIIQQKYADAKAAFDRDDFIAAVDGFKQVLAALGDPDVSSAASQPPLADLRTLATGFHDLSAKAAAPPAPLPATEVPAVPQAPKVYSANDPRIVAPMVIVQRIPNVPGKVKTAGTGIVEVVIDETGSVETARMRVPINGVYDKLVLAAAKSWQYQPATMDGTAVKFRKLVQVTLVPTP